MRTNFINKHGMKIMLAILMVLAVLTSSIVSAYFIISTKGDIVIDKDNNMPDIAPPTQTGAKVETLPLKDGEVPGGSESFKVQYANNSAWIAINNIDQMRAWLANNDGKNAYLNNNIDYYSSSGDSNGYAAWATNSQLDSVDAGRIFDGCGYTINLIPPNKPNSWTDSVWQEKNWDNRYPYSLFAAYNEGTIRNANFKFVDRNLGLSDGGGKQVVAGLVTAYNNGEIYNISFEHNSTFRLHVNNTGDKATNAIWLGAIAGSNRKTIANSTVIFGSQAVLDSRGAGGKAGTFKPDNAGYAFTAGITGESVNGNEINNTVIATKYNGSDTSLSTIRADGYTQDCAGGCVAEKSGGTISGFALVGTLDSVSADIRGVAAGKQNGTFSTSGIYTEKLGNLGSAQRIGTGAGSDYNYVKVNSNDFSVQFNKGEDFATNANAGTPELIITPTIGTGSIQRPSVNHIVWSVKFMNDSNVNLAEYELKDLAKEIITGSFKISNKADNQPNTLKIDYGIYGALTSYTIVDRIYNGQEQGMSAQDSLVFQKSNGETFSCNGDTSGVSYTYNESNILPKNAGEYSLVMSNMFIDDANKILGYNPNKISSPLFIKPKDLNFNIDDFHLSNYSKVYDYTSNGPSYTILDYATGIGTDSIKFEITTLQYLSKDVGENKPLSFDLIFSAYEEANSNYLLDGKDWSSNTYTVNRGIITPAPITLDDSDISIDTYTKVYDKTDVYKGVVTYSDAITTQYGEVIKLNNVVGKYNSKEVGADKVIVSYGLLEDLVSKNYILSSTTKEFAGASITPYHISINWDDFEAEDFYIADGSSKIERAYDGTTVIDGTLLNVKNPFATVLDEIIKLKYVDGQLANKNANASIGLKFTFEFDQLSVGSQEINGVTYDIANYNNYILDNNFVDTTAKVTPKMITLTDDMFSLDLQKTYDGTTAYVGKTLAQNTINGVLDETITLSNISAVYNSKNVMSADKITISFTQADRNYSFSVTPVDNVYSYAIGASIVPYQYNVTESMLNVVASKIYDTTTDYVGDAITQNSITVELTGGIENITLSSMAGVYAFANVTDQNNVITVSIAQNDTNFIINSTVDISATITPYTLILQASDFNLVGSKVYDGNTNAVISQNAIVGLAGQDIILKDVVANYNSKNVSEANAITIGFALQENATNSNYVLRANNIAVNNQESMPINITAKSFAVEQSHFADFSKTKIYDATDAYNGNVVMAGNLPTGIASEELVININSVKFNTTVVKTDNTTKIIVTISQNDSNYSINSTVEFDATITPFVLNDIANIAFDVDGVKIYDGNTTVADSKVVAKSFASGVAEETVTLTLTNAVYNSANVAEANAIAVTFTIDDTNYAIGNITTLSYDASITAKDITLTKDSFVIATSKEYDKTTSANIQVIDGGIVTDVVVGEGFEILILDSLTATYNAVSVKDASAITVKFTTANTNYNITNAESGFDVSGVITDKIITVTADNFTVTKSKTYDGATTAEITDYSIVANQESIVLDTGYSASYDSKNVGENKVITVSFSESLDNYAFSNNTVTFNDGIITAKAITVNKDIFSYSDSKVYDTTTNYNGNTITANAIKTGVVVDDVEEEINLIIGDSVVYNSKNVADASSIKVLISQIDANYSIVDSIDLDATITAYSVTDAMDDMSRYTLTTEKVFDNSNVANITINEGFATITGLSGETFGYTVSAKYKQITVGTGIVIDVTITSEDANYTFNITTFVGSTDGKITATTLTISLDNFVFEKTKQYDGTTKVVITSYDIKGAVGETVLLKDGYYAVYNDENVASGKTITIYFELADDGYSASTTVLTYTPAEGEVCEITKRTVNLTKENFDYLNSKTYDGTTNYDNAGNAITVKNSGAVATGVGTDTITVTAGTDAIYNSANVGDGNYITVSVSMLDSVNYEISATVNLEASVTAKEIVVAEGNFSFAKTKSYDGNTTVTITADDIATGIGSETITLTDITANYNSKNVTDANAITITFSQANSNYALSVTTLEVTNANITAYKINTTEVNSDVVKEKTFDGNDTANVTTDGTTITVTTNETVSIATAIATYDNKNFGSAKEITLVITITDTNYELDFANIVYNDGVITKKQISVEYGNIIVDTQKTYDGTTDYVGATASHNTIAGACGADEIILEFGNIIYNSKDVATANALTVNFALAGGANATVNDNYQLTASQVDITANIVAYEILISESDLTFDKAKTYDGVVDVAIVQKTINGVSVQSVYETITLDRLVAYYNSKNVAEANKIIIEFALGENDTNYTLTQITFAVEDADVKINKHSITADDVTYDVTNTKVYDANDTASVVSISINGVNNETVAYESAVASYDSKNVGTDKTITLVIAIADTNYQLGFADIAIADATITAKDITVTTTDITVDTQKTYDATTDYVGQGAVHGVISGACGEDVIALTFGNIAYNTKDVISANALTVNFTQNDANYNLLNTSVVISANIIAKQITLTEDNFTFDKSRVYNNSDIVAIAQKTINGVVSEDVITLVNVLAKYNSKNVVDANIITISFALNEDITNYTLNGQESIGVSGADVMITPFVITSQHVDFQYTANKTYDTTTAVNDVNYSINFENIGFTDDALALASYSASYENKNVATNKNINFAYTIDNANYVLENNAETLTKTYSDGVIIAYVITPSVEEFSVVKSKQYTGDNSAELSNTKAVKGVNGELVDIDVTATYYTGDNFNVGEGKSIKIEFVKAVSENNVNYDLSVLFVEVANCEIVKKQITVTENDFVITNTKTYDATRTATVAPKTIQGVYDETILLVVNSALFNSDSVERANSIMILFALSTSNINKNYVIANEVSQIVYTTDVAITPSLLTVNFSNTEQSFRNNPKPLSNVVLSIVSGTVAGQMPLLKLQNVDINVGVAGEYTLAATTTDTNYAVANTAILKLDVFAKQDGKFLIQNIDDFNVINTDSAYLAYSFMQTADIDMNYATMKGIKGNFSGTYDGNGFMIKNTFLYDAPLFETLSGTIINLNIANMVVISYTDRAMGGVVGVIENSGVVENTVFEGSLYVYNTGAAVISVGGIAGESAGRISSVKVFAIITVKADVSYVGGIVAKNTGAINAIVKDGVKDLNRVMVEIIAVGDGANVDAVAANNSATIDANDTLYLKGANVKEASDGTYTVVDSNLGTGVAFNVLSSGDNYLFGSTKLISFLSAYKNDFGLNLTSNYVLEINTLRDFALIGQYNYLEIKFKANFAFHKYYEHYKFNKVLVGNVTFDANVVLPELFTDVTDICKYNK